MELGNAAGWVAAFVAFVAVNASTIQWLLKRRDDQRERDSSRVTDLEDALTDPVDASGTMHRGIFMTHVYLSDPLVQVVNPAPVQVTVIMERAPERPVPTGSSPDTPR